MDCEKNRKDTLEEAKRLYEKGIITKDVLSWIEKLRENNIELDLKNSPTKSKVRDNPFFWMDNTRES